MPVLAAEDLSAIASSLIEARAHHLQNRPIASIVDVLDRVAAAWLDESTPERILALDALPLVTGFSRAMVEESIDLEQRSSRSNHMWRALRSEFGDPAVLDGFTPSRHLGGGGQTMAVGPRLTAAVFSSNIPALPHLTVMRSLLVKSAFWARSSTREPTFLPLYLDTLEREDPGLAACCASLWWPSEDRAMERAWLDGSDFFVGWGGPDAEKHFRQEWPRGETMVFHGHRVGFAIVEAEEATGKAADGLALDVSRFDQQACLSPQAVFFAGSLEAGVAFGQQLALGLARVAERLEPRRLDAGEAAAVQQFRGVAELQQAMGQGALIVPAVDDLSWSVAVERGGRFPMSPLHRCITVCVVDGWGDIERLVEPLRGWLQNAALAVGDHSADSIRSGLARLGVSRLCKPGDMGTPSMMWHHDGRACLASMVRWCDEERVSPSDVD
jgi:hypothetical protein